MKTNVRLDVVHFLKRYVQQNPNYDYIITNMHLQLITIKIRNTYNKNTILTFVVTRSQLAKVEQARKVYAKNIFKRVS